MGKGELTRTAILDRAMCLSTKVGLDGLTIGGLADDLHMSKSGLFAHFRSKEALQLQLLQHARDVFVDAVVRPALKAPRGATRVRALVDRWLLWAREAPGRGGCLFVGAATELDDKPGPVRESLVRQQRDWLDFIGGAVQMAVDEGDFRQDTDPAQFAHELHGIMLGHYHAARLLRDQSAELRTRRAFDRLFTSARQVPNASVTARAASKRTAAKPRGRAGLPLTYRT
jgi:AcrR family transcriptional regulator